MKILHTGDLHIGKTVNNFNMLEDQKHVLTQMVDYVKEKEAQVFIIAGDVYDRAIPTAEAVSVFDDFIERLHELGVTILCISGNHDSPERLSFAQEILEKKGVHFAGVYKGKCKQVRIMDEDGPVVFTLMPFVKPALLLENSSDTAVRRMLADTFCDGSDMVFERVSKEIVERGRKERQVLITHYFVTNAGMQPELSDSESHVLVGGLDNVDCSLFSGFHYTALGHIHKPQRMDKDNTLCGPVIYSGSPLAYSFSECGQQKGVVYIELDGDGNARMENLPLTPLRKMRKLKGSLINLTDPMVVSMEPCEDYLQITLTDEEELIDPIGTLRRVYPNVMQLLFEKREKETAGTFTARNDIADKPIEELFADFYELVRGQRPDEAREQVIKEVIEETV